MKEYKGELMIGTIIAAVNFGAGVLAAVTNDWIRRTAFERAQSRIRDLLR